MTPRVSRVLRSGSRAGARALLPLLLLSAAAAQPLARSSEDCMVCHSDSTLTADRKGKQVSLFVDPARLAASPHAGMDCVDCHAGFKADELPHKPKISPVNCMSCHSDAAEKHPFHAKMVSATGTDGSQATSCKGCHGTHAVAAVSPPDSGFHGQRLTPFCGKCHATIAAQFSASAHGKALASGEPGAPECLACHLNPITQQRAGGPSADLKIAQERICLACHLDNPEVRSRVGPDAGFIAAYEKSVHGAALLRGNGAAATCIDCHGSHEMGRGVDPRARVSKAHIPQTCAACHGEIAARYAESVHGKAVAKGNADAPVCTNCHGEHNILLHTDPNSPVAAANVSQQVCSPCHASVRMAQKYGIASDRFQTFSDSYHGLALRGGSVEAANCASCHGSHDIRPSSDPASSVNHANLAATCGRCHPGANERFGIGPVHVVATEAKSPILYWIATGYVILIVVTVVGMLLHNLLDFLRKSRRKLRIRGGTAEEYGEEEEPAGHALYLRMTVGERIQHGCLMTSFMVLVVTGFMLSYPEAWWVVAIRSLSDHVFQLRSLLHRIAAAVLTLASLYHLGYVSFTARGRGLVKDLLPSPQDARDAVLAIAHNVGLTRRRPRFGRFGYVEKIEYWALLWGTMVMAVTGIFMWFENTFIGLLTKLGYDIARTIHFYEAWLATLAVLIWHIYYVVFNPDAYPMNMAWLTGRITEAEMAEEHPLELEEIRLAQAEKEVAVDSES